MIKILAVACGGALGSVSRYGIALSVEKLGHLQFPLGTFMANVLGCFLIGICWGHFDRVAVSNEFRLLIFTGFLGGFTTFSTFARESTQFFKAGDPFHGIAYILTSNIIGIVSVLLGFYLVGKIWR